MLLIVIRLQVILTDCFLVYLLFTSALFLKSCDNGEQTQNYDVDQSTVIIASLLWDPGLLA